MKKRKTIHNKNVLLAGGNKTQWALIKNILENSGANVSEESSVTNVLPRMRRFAPHSILFDLDLGQEKIWPFLEEKQANESFQNIPVIVLTSQPDRELLKKSLAHGAVDALVKPVESMTLIKKINKYTQESLNMSFRFDENDADLKAQASIPGELIKLSPVNLYVEIPAKLASNQKIEVESNVLKALQLTKTRLKTTGHPPTYVAHETFICSIKFAGLSNQEANNIRRKIGELKVS